MFADFLFRLRAIFRRRAVESEMEAELRFHVERQIEKYVQSGATREEAARRARLEFGSYEQIKEEYREARGVSLIETLVRDVRFGFRALRNNLGFSMVAILTLALGIGANTAIFSVVYAALIRPLPYAQPNRLITLSEARLQYEQSTQSDTRIWNTSYPDYLDWQRQSKSFQALAGFSGDGFIVHGGGEAELVTGDAWRQAVPRPGLCSWRGHRRRTKSRHPHSWHLDTTIRRRPTHHWPLHPA